MAKPFIGFFVCFSLDSLFSGFRILDPGVGGFCAATRRYRTRKIFDDQIIPNWLGIWNNLFSRYLLVADVFDDPLWPTAAFGRLFSSAVDLSDRWSFSRDFRRLHVRHR